MKKRGRFNECRLIAPFPRSDNASINGSDALLVVRVQLNISQRTQVSSTPTSTQTKPPTSVSIMSSSGFDNAWNTYVCGSSNSSSCSNGSIMKALGNNNSGSSTKSWGGSSSANLSGSSFGTGSSGFNNAWGAYTGTSGSSSAW